MVVVKVRVVEVTVNVDIVEQAGVTQILAKSSHLVIRAVWGLFWRVLRGAGIGALYRDLNR